MVYGRFFGCVLRNMLPCEYRMACKTMSSDNNFKSHSFFFGFRALGIPGPTIPTAWACRIRWWSQRRDSLCVWVCVEREVAGTQKCLLGVFHAGLRVRHFLQGPFFKECKFLGQVALHTFHIPFVTFLVDTQVCVCDIFFFKSPYNFMNTHS